MRTPFIRLGVLVVVLAIQGNTALGEANKAKPKVEDKLRSVRLTQGELSGEIGRRLDELIEKNFMVIDLERDFVEPFRKRPAGDRRYIGVGKVIDAGSRFAAYTGDPRVARRTARLIEELMKTRDADGYLGHMPVEPDGQQNGRNWILHDQEYSVLGLVDHWRYCGDRKSLDYAREVADYILKSFPRVAQRDRVCTAGLPEAMLTLYGCTGDRRYLTFAADMPHGFPHGETEHASLRKWRKDNLTGPTTSHVYVNVARCYAQTMLYRWEGDEGLLEASRFVLRELTRRGGCLFVIGSASDGERFSYTQNGRGPVAESCVTDYLIRWFGSLLRLEGDLRYGDLIERAVYNALFAAQDPAGRRIRYFTPFEGPRRYFENDGFCCPGNHRRIIAELPEMVYYQTADGAVVLNLFTQSKKTFALPGGRSVTIQQETDYPTSGVVKIQVTPSEPTEFSLRLRIPRWCPKATLTLAGEPARPVAPGAKYFELRRTWSPGDTLTLDMPMPWRLVRGHQTQEGRVALMRGPVVYCIGTAQNTELLKKIKAPNDLVLDPTSLGRPVADPSVRPDGLKVSATARLVGSDKSSPPLAVVLTEFVDPTGVATYFRIPDLSVAVEDELISAAGGLGTGVDIE
ncbi:MAG: glycoside hydrolase family 127 protein [Pirellulales bacterium]|nr:glycoside hydrolase family 127 protein [Pirellulales bacterium]